jgi:hypothetical protein
MAAATTTNNFEPKIVVKRGSTQEILTLDSWNQSIHLKLAAHYGIPLDRLKLLVRGKQYGRDENQALIDAHLSSNSPIMVVGTASELQLDSTQNVVRNGKNAIVDFIISLPGWLWFLINSIIQFVWTFFSSMFVKHTPQPLDRQQQPNYA